jgi:hypothetical protein
MARATLVQLEAYLRREMDRAFKDADMSTAQEDLDYHTGEYDAYNMALYALLGKLELDN